MLKGLSLICVVLILVIINIWRGGQPIETDSPIHNSDSSSIQQKPETLGVSSDAINDQNWLVYQDKKSGYSIRYPSNVILKHTPTGIGITSDTLDVSITALPLLAHDTVNTKAEKDINSKTENLKEQFILLDTISPVSVSSITGITYTTLEQEKEVTYFYIPTRDKYLLITNRTDVNNQDQINLSDKIIYSIETN